MSEIIKNTWFFTTNLKSEDGIQNELQDTLLLECPCPISLQNSQKDGLIISGSVGVGKTRSALLLSRDYINDTYEANKTWHYSFEPVFINFMQFVKLLHDRKFGSEAEKSQAYYKILEIKETPFLIFDDLRCKFESEFEKTSVDNALLDLFSIIWAGRKNKKLIVTTNNSQKEIEQVYSEAVCSRLFNLCGYFEALGEDKRGGTEESKFKIL